MGQIHKRDEADGSLVARVLEGDQRAYGILVDRYVAEFGRYATALCRDADLAADAMQESFIRAYDALESLDDADRFGAWFFRILTNQCHNHRDRHKPHVRLDQVMVTGDSPERHLAAVEIRAAINQALETLTPDLRETFVLREVEGRSYAEIAELLQVSEAALRKRVERAREIVRPALEELL
jgi:RNA polymerase sigma-70 factor (ECF subfamily)